MKVLSPCIGLLGLLLCSEIAYQKVLLYYGPGVAHDLAEHFLSSLWNTDGGTAASKVSASYFDTEDWEANVSMVVIPGGRDLEYLRDFSSSALERIRRWVRERGGSFLGLCGGAYFGSGRVEFELYGPFAVQGERPLALYPGTAYGAALRPFDYAWNEHLPAANVRIMGWKRPAIASVYYMGGCYFEADEVLGHRWSILATYTHSGRPAIISGRVGRGRVILSCPHIEVSLEHLVGLEGSWMYRQMARTPKRRAALFRSIIRKLQLWE